MKIISKSKYSIASKENILSFFTLDCLSQNLKVFYNMDINLNKCINLICLGINYKNLNYSLKKIKKEEKIIKIILNLRCKIFKIP